MVCFFVFNAFDVIEYLGYGSWSTIAIWTNPSGITKAD